MSRILRFAWRSLFVLFVTTSFGFGAESAGPKPGPELQRQLASFLGAKQQQAETVLATANLAKPEQLDNLFAAMARGDSQTASNHYRVLDDRFRNRRNGSRELGVVWQIVMEAHTGWDAFHTGSPDLMERFGREIIAVVPEGAVYFGGTDPGRFVVTALCQSHAEARPFFTLTQNQLADARYMDYARHLYGSRLTIPSQGDERTVIGDYVTDYRERKEQGKVGADEHVSVDGQGRISLSGLGSVMAINGLLVKRIMGQNPKREYFMEESYPITWLYPHLEALCPYSPEAIWRYYTLLTSRGRTDEAGVLLRTAHAFTPHDQQLREWLDGAKNSSEE